MISLTNGIAKRIAKFTDLSELEARHIMRLALREVRAALKRGDKVTLWQVATLVPVLRQARRRYNPATKEVQDYPATRQLTVRVSPSFRKDFERPPSKRLTAKSKSRKSQPTK